ncbi:hypothetical protein QUA81_17420 [Microcoleus sp. F6_B4]
MLADIGRFDRPYLIAGEAKRRESTGLDIKDKRTIARAIVLLFAARTISF